MRRRVLTTARYDLEDSDRIFKNVGARVSLGNEKNL